MADKWSYVADFETTCDIVRSNNGNIDYVKSRAWVWEACLMPIFKQDRNNLKYEMFYDLESFMNYLPTMHKKNDHIIVYFHNLGFDGMYILYNLMKNGKTRGTKRLKDDTYSTAIDETGKWYGLKIKKNGRYIEFRDSFKILPMSEKKIAESMKLDTVKGEIDYNKKRAPGYIPTKEEIDYVANDCYIIVEALRRTIFETNHDKLTIGSLCWWDFNTTNHNVKRIFPEINITEDEFVRESYRGGICMVGKHKRYNGKISIIDYNAMYPSVMHSKSGNIFPCGKGTIGAGKYEYDPEKPCYFQHIKCNIKVKENHFPFIQERTYNGTGSFIENDDIDVVLAGPDMELLFEQYDVLDIEYVEYIKYSGVSFLFDRYIEKWSKVKEESKDCGNFAMYVFAKLMLNNLYGKLATKPGGNSKYYELTEDGRIVHTEEQSDKNAIYIPAGSYITSYARKELLTTAMKCGGMEKVLYMDTDSIHMIGNLPEGIPLHNSKLHHWKLEGIASKGIYIRQKTYAELIDGEWDIKAAGCPDSCKKNITDVENTFDVGLKVWGKLVPMYVTGGTILVESSFEIVDTKKPLKDKIIEAAGKKKKPKHEIRPII